MKKVKHTLTDVELKALLAMYFASGACFADGVMSEADREPRSKKDREKGYEMAGVEFAERNFASSIDSIKSWRILVK